MDTIEVYQASFAQQLAARIVATDATALQPESVYWRKAALLDTVGVMLANTLSTTHQPGQFAPDDNACAHARITLNDGRAFAMQVERALGRTAQNAIAHTRMRDKFRDGARRVLREDAVEALLTQIGRVETAASVTQSCDGMVPIAQK